MSSCQIGEPGLPARPVEIDGRGTSALDPYEESNLTRNQLQIWIAQNLLPEVPIYNLAVALHLEWEIDPHHFQKAFRVLVDSRTRCGR